MDNIFSYKPSYLSPPVKSSLLSSSSVTYGTSFMPVSFDAMNCIIDPTEELGGLYLGNYDAASDISLLKRHRIGAVLTVAAGTGLHYHPDAVQSHDMIPAMDVDYYDMSKHFDRCFEFIDRNRKSTNVLVHCWAGVSRSATIVIAYLMKKYDFSFDESHSFVKKKRKQIYPNPGFVRQMRTFDSQLRLKRNKAKESNLESKYRMNLSNSSTFGQNNMRSSSLAATSKAFTPEKAKKNDSYSSNFQTFYSRPSMNNYQETVAKKPVEKLYEAPTATKNNRPYSYVSYYPEKFSYDRYAYLRNYK